MTHVKAQTLRHESELCRPDVKNGVWAGRGAGKRGGYIPVFCWWGACACGARSGELEALFVPWLRDVTPLRLSYSLDPCEASATRIQGITQGGRAQSRG